MKTEAAEGVRLAGQPAFEMLEPRLLLSADLCNSSSLLSLPTPGGQDAIVVDLKQEASAVQEMPTPLVGLEIVQTVPASESLGQAEGTIGLVSDADIVSPPAENESGPGALLNLGDRMVPADSQDHDPLDFPLTGPASPPMVRVAYVVPSDRTAQADAVTNLRYAMEVSQDWYREQMERNGFGAKTFLFETEADGATPLIHTVQVSETDDYLRADIWGRVNQAASNAGVPLWVPGQVWLLVPEIHLEHPDGSIEGGVCLGASWGSGIDPGVAMVGSNGLVFMSAQDIVDNTPYDGQIIPEIGPYPLVQDVSFAWFEGSTMSSVASAYLGATLHEVSHGFGLPHEFRNDANYHGNVMGNGLRGIRGAIYPELYPGDDMWLSPGQALALSTSRYFNPGEQALETNAPSLSIATAGTVTPVEGRLNISFSASDDSGLASALLVRNGEQIAEMALTGLAATRTFATPYYDAGQTGTFAIVAYDIYGNRRQAEVSITPAAGCNDAPKPFIKLDSSWLRVGQTVVLDASQSTDPDDSVSLVSVEWDLNGDGLFDTAPTTTKKLTTSFAQSGTRLISARLTDPHGAQAVSAPIPVRVLEAAAEITVLGNGLSIADGDTIPSTGDGTDFGSVAQGGGGTSRTFTVRNDGTLALTLGAVAVPAGFTLTEALSGSLAAGQSDTFTVRLDAATWGDRTGTISFTNNDSDENPFDFQVRGSVTGVSIDDMESYNDDDHRIYDTWIDGWTNGTGSQVGYVVAPFAEETIVHGGAQSMPFYYNNDLAPFYSEASRTFAAAQNWTANGVDTLSLWVRGHPLPFVQTGPGAFTVSGAGHDIWDNADDFQFVYLPLTGDGTITARVDGIVNTNAWAKCGVMVRESLTEGSKFAAVYATPGNGVRFQARLTTSAAAVSDSDVATAEQMGLRTPAWVRLQRSGDSVACFYSTDGASWTAMSWNPQTISMTGTVYIGLAVTSHNTSAATTAQFSNVSTSAAGTWHGMWLGNDDSLTNDADHLYVALQDAAGHVGAVSSPSTMLVNASTWTEWRIPLSSFAGVDPTRVAKMYLGVGDRQTPVADGNGVIFIDDIALMASQSAAAVTVAVAPSAVMEDGVANLVYTFTRSVSSSSPLTVNFNVAGTAAHGTDYTQTGAAGFDVTSGSVTIPADQTTAQVTVDPTADATVESDETMILTVTGGTGYTVGTPSVATGTIQNDDSGPANLALGKTAAASTTYSGLPASNVTDGNLSSRWSSLFSDSQWLYVDLGSVYAVSRVVLRWEAAYGRGYKLQVSDDASIWSDVYSTTAGDGGVDDIMLGTPASGRYVRMLGTQRATAYGYSLWEFEVYGGGGGAPVVTVAVAPAAVAEDGATNLVYTFTRSLADSSPLAVSFSVGGTATFATDYTQTGAGSFNATSGTVTIAASQTAAQVTVDPTADMAVEPDETVILTVTGGTGYTVGAPSVATGTIQNDDGGAVNLALGRPTTASTSYSGLPPVNATDGNTASRWSSLFSDNEWIHVDLGSVYTISRVVLRWETAYGRGYRLQVSSNGSAWSDAYSTTTGDGGLDDITLSSSGRYVRVLGTQRGTMYGYSLWEFEVYGGAPTNHAPAVSSFSKSGTQDTPLPFAAAEFAAAFTDPDAGDSLQKIKIASLPGHGELTFNGAAVSVDQEIATAEVGALVYTPNGGYTGSDSFQWNGSDGSLYAATDAAVNLSIHAEGGNLALGKTAVSSTNYAGLPPSNATDGNANSRWSSQFSDNEWIYVDLGSTYTMNRVVLRWETAYGRGYKLQVSGNASTWADVYSTTTGNGGVDDIALPAPASGRFVRMLGTERGTVYGYSLYELEVYAGAAPPNLVLHKSVTASTSYPGLPASNVADGNTSSRWSSQFGDSEWIYVDLGAVYAIKQVVLRWETAYGRGYKLQVSDDASTWSDVYSTTTGDGGVDDITLAAPVSGRYVRLLGTQRATVYGYSLWEFEVYG